MLTYPDPDPANSGKLIHKAVATCLFPLCGVDGMVVTTTEGLGSVRDGLHVIQETFVKNHATQCGMCTPGMVMELYAACLNNRFGPCLKALHEIEECFDGNLCRCTGYRSIRDSVREIVLGSASHIPASDAEITEEMCQRSLLSKISPPAFPDELRARHARNLVFSTPVSTWHRPTCLSQVLSLRDTHPGAALVAGNSEVGMKINSATVPPVQISLSHVPELHGIEMAHGNLVVGSATALVELQAYVRWFLGNLCKTQDYTKEDLRWTRPQALHNMLEYFASHNVRNVASLGGNICNGSPVSDMLPLMMSFDAVCECVSLNADREIVVREVSIHEWLKGYKKTALAPTEVLRAVRFAFPGALPPKRGAPAAGMLEFSHAQKQTRRKEDDIAVVNGAFFLRVEHVGEQYFVRHARAAFGSMSFVTVAAKRTEEMLIGRDLASPDFLEPVLACLRDEMQLAPDAPGGMIRYRRIMALTFFYKLYMGVCQHLGLRPIVQGAPLDPEEPLFVSTPEHPVPTQQHYDIRADLKVVGQPVPMTSGAYQTSGEAVYASDVIMPHNGTHGVLLLSAKPHAKILRIDPSAALACPGVVALVTRDDVRGANCIGPIVHDEECFVPVGGTAQHVGAALGVLVADTEAEARAAVKLVKVEYEELPPIYTIDEAIAAQAFLEQPYTQNRGDVERGFAESAHVIDGVVYEGGQIHFCFEPNITIATPGEGDTMDILTATQNVSLTQRLVAHVLNVKSSDLTVRTKRLGGAFGSKETRAAWLACAAAVAAQKVGLPVRLTVSREEDMLTQGHRSPFKIEYRLGFMGDGRLHAAEFKVYANSGISLDCSYGVLKRSVNHVDCCYYCPNFRVTGRLCKSNKTSNTAFRGFGGPEGMLAMESGMAAVALKLGMDQAEIRLKNAYREGQITHYHQRLVNPTIGPIFEQLLRTGEYNERRAAVRAFNASHRFVKRGLGFIGVKYGCSFESFFMNQGQALVHLHQDGTVQVSHGGAEMGQGLHIKMAQVAAEAFNVPLDRVTVVQETSTLQCANTQPTAASSGTDLNGMAVLAACKEIFDRLAPLRAEAPGKTLAEYAKMAFLRRIDLSAHSYFATPHLGDTSTAEDGEELVALFSYFAFGASLTEVEVDVLSGDFRIVRADMIEDVGKSINPAIDIGQIEGAYLQGVGLYTMEEPVWTKSGDLFTKGPGYYKIPSYGDQPHDLRITLLPNSANPHAVHSSKAVGEPPFFLASSVVFALMDAVNACRAERGLPLQAPSWTPLTCERIRMLCAGDTCMEVVDAGYAQKEAEHKAAATPVAPADRIPPVFELPDQ